MLLMAMQDSLVTAADQRTEVVNYAFLVQLAVLLTFPSLSACKICISFKHRSETVMIAEIALFATCRAPVSSLTDLSAREVNPVAPLSHITLRSCQYSPYQRPLRILDKSRWCS